MAMKKRVLPLLLLALASSVVTVFLNCCVQIDEKPYQGKPEAEEVQKEAVITKSPKKPVDKYKGVWMPFMRETRIALDDIDNLKLDGINIVSIGIKVCLTDEITECESEDEIIDVINEFHKNGIRTFLILNPAHPDFGVNPFSSEASGRALLDKLTPLVLKWANISEDYGVEMFCPANEPQMLSYQNEKDVSDWAQQLLPELREVYHGKIAFIVQTFGEGIYAYDLSGYDYIANGGLTCTKDIEEHPDWIERVIKENTDRLKSLYPGQKYILFGAGAFTGPDYYWWEPIAPENMLNNMPELPVDFFTVSSESQAEYYNILFNETWEPMEGYFIPVFKGWEYRGKPAERVIREWFNTAIATES